MRNIVWSTTGREWRRRARQVGQKGCIEELKFWMKLSLNVMQGGAVR
jgi:hypothetical protein